MTYHVQWTADNEEMDKRSSSDDPREESRSTVGEADMEAQDHLMS